jgi:hypothetical protein
MFSTVTTCQLLIPRLVSHHRGTATSPHQTIYYVLGGVASLGLCVRRSDTLAGHVR